MISILAQINTGTPFDPLLNDLFVNYGSLPTFLLIIAGVVVWAWFSQSKADARQQEAITTIATKSTSKLDEVQTEFLEYKSTSQKEFLEYKTTAEYQRGIF